MSGEEQTVTFEALGSLLEALRPIADDTRGMANSLSLVSEVRARFHSDSISDPDTGNYDAAFIISLLGDLAEAFRLALVALGSPTAKGAVLDLNRVQRLLVDMISIRVGEGDDLSQMVECQGEARAILRGDEH